MRLTALALVLCLSLPGLAGDPPGDKKPDGSPAATMTPLEEAIVQATNRERKKRDLPPLQVEPRLVRAAQRHAAAMAQKKETTHDLDGKTLTDRAKDVGYDWRAIAENVASGYTTADEVVAGWMDSEGHRQNILDEKKLGLTQIGVGAHKGADGQLYFCQVFGKPAPKTP